MTTSQTTYTLEEQAKQLNLQPDATLRFGNGKVTTFLTPDTIRAAVMFKGLTAETLIEAIKFFNVGFKSDTRKCITDAVYKSIGNSHAFNSVDDYCVCKEIDLRIIINRRKTLFGSKLDVLILAATTINSGSLYVLKASGGGLLI